MAEVQRKLKTDNSTGKTSEPTKSARSERASRSEAAREDGVERLGRAVDKRVRKNSEKLADLLMNKALGGDLASARVLVMIAGRKRPRPAPVKKVQWPTLAMRLAALPDCEEPAEEGVWEEEEDARNREQRIDRRVHEG
jgi:hypothetical protein